MLPTCQETKVPVVFSNGMLLIRHKKQVSVLSPKEAALKTLAQSLKPERSVFLQRGLLLFQLHFLPHSSYFVYMWGSLVRKKESGLMEGPQILFLCAWSPDGIDFTVSTIKAAPPFGFIWLRWISLITFKLKEKELGNGKLWNTDF